MAWIGVPDPATQLVQPLARAGDGLDYLEKIVVRSSGPEGQGPTGRALSTGQAAVCQDVAADPRMLPWREQQLAHGFRCSGAFPFRWGGSRGALTVYLAEPNAIGPDESDLFVELASDVGAALETLEQRAERRRAEEALRLQKETLQAIVDNIPEMVVFFDASVRPLIVNRDFERILGWTAEEARRVDLLAELYPDPVARQRAAEFIGASAGRWAEFRTRTRGGGTIDTEWVNVRLSDGTIIGVGRDVTERRQLEGQFRQAQKMEAVGRLAGGVAHDFNNLLGVITGYAELCLRVLEPGHPALPRLEQVLRAAERAAGLTKQLLAFSRRQTLEPRLVDLNIVLHDLEKMLHRLIGEDVTLEMRLAAGSGVVRTDPGQFELLVMNLVVNARDAMPGGGTISIETGDAEAAEFSGSAHWRVGGPLRAGGRQRHRRGDG
jgi:PAS domain S-box-containing protein